MADACRALGIPIVSGNVSLYNETEGRPIHPTPVVGCVGLVPDVRQVPRGWRAGDAILLASAGAVVLDGSEYQALYDTPHGRAPELDLEAEAALIRFLWQTAPQLSLAHDAGRGGLAMALAQAALWSGLGADVDLSGDAVALFGEGGGQAVVACEPGVAETLPWPRIGTAGGDALLGATLTELAEAYR
jgi:phosphoribosylformylglycinamidine synthase